MVAKAAVPTFTYSVADLDRFRTVQRYAYTVATQAEASLQVGMTERDLAEQLAANQGRAGVTQLFHENFVWFGPRTCLGSDWVGVGTNSASLERLPGSPFLPTDAMLEENEPLILDIAPVINGYPADIGYSCIVGQDEVFDELIAGLEPVRDLLEARVRSGDTLRSIYHALDGFIAQNGWTNVHSCYPLGALGHLLVQIDHDPAGSPPTMGSSVWNDGPGADLPPVPGIWAVEPHIAKFGIGAKWEEILVVTPDDAFWLDDDLPHHRRWAGKSPPSA